MGSIIFLIVSLSIAIFIGYDAHKRGMNRWIWGIVGFLFSIFGVIIYLFVRKPKTDIIIINNQQSKLNETINILKSKDYNIEYRDNFAVKGHVILYYDDEYEIISNKTNSIELKLVIPTNIRLWYGLLITIIASVILSIIIKGFALFGIVFLLFSTYIVDAWYKDNRKNKTAKINEKVKTSLNSNDDTSASLDIES
jgi:hypothetical protein